MFTEQVHMTLYYYFLTNRIVKVRTWKPGGTALTVWTPKFIHLNKHEMQNLLDEELLHVECQQQSLTLCQVSHAKGLLFGRNLKKNFSTPAMFTVQRFELNCFCIVLYAI